MSGGRTGGPSRRGFLRGAGLVGGGAAAGVVAGGAVGRYAVPAGGGTPDDALARLATPVAYRGAHQAGVVDRAPAHLRFQALDLRPTASAGAARTALRQALAALGPVAEAMTAGRWVGAQEQVADGLRPAHLTVTVGLGGDGLRAAGLAVPAALTPLPAFPGDRLDPARSDGHVGLQVCSEDPQVAASAARALVRTASAWLAPRWQQTGFLPGVAGTLDPTATRRNLMGQLDGTGNPPSGAERDAAVWVPGGTDAPWMEGGTYLVCRRIAMFLDSWERLSGPAQEGVIGRTRATGAPLSRPDGSESDQPDFGVTGPDGRPAIATNAHVRLTHPLTNSGATMLRRAYSFDEGYEADGSPRAGLFFQAFQTDPQTVFVPVMVKLAALDALMPFVRHEASAVFAVPPGVPAGAAGYPGQALLEG